MNREIWLLKRVQWRRWKAQKCIKQNATHSGALCYPSMQESDKEDDSVDVYRGIITVDNDNQAAMM